MLALGIGALQIVLDKGQEEDWFASRLDHRRWRSSRPWRSLRFVVHELRTPSTRSWTCGSSRIRTYGTGVFLMTMLGFVLYGSLVLLPILLQTLLGYPALQAGIAMAPRGLGSFIAMPIVGMLLARFDPRKLLALRAAWAAPDAVPALAG